MYGNFMAKVEQTVVEEYELFEDMPDVKCDICLNIPHGFAGNERHRRRANLKQNKRHIFAFIDARRWKMASIVTYAYHDFQTIFWLMFLFNTP